MDRRDGRLYCELVCECVVRRRRDKRFSRAIAMNGICADERYRECAVVSFSTIKPVFFFQRKGPNPSFSATGVSAADI